MPDGRHAGLDRSPRLHDVAEAAKVSVSTVSRYLNGQLPLKAETEARLLKAIDAVGYRRQDRNRHDSPAHTSAIGLVVPQIGNAQFGRIAESIVNAAESYGLSVLICSTLNHPRKQLDYVNLLVSQDVAGIVYAGNYRSNRALSSVIDSGRPVVVIDEALVDAPPVDTVLVDDYSGAYQAVAYLTNLGHRRIALVTGPASLHSVHERTRAYQDALRKAGISIGGQTILRGVFTEESGVSALSHLLASPEPPTAVFAAADIVALGIMVASRTLGVSIPGDLSIVGFDDIPDAAYVTPRLTTVRTRVHEMASTALTMLADRISDPTRPTSTSITAVSLVVGDSAAPPPAAAP